MRFLNRAAEEPERSQEWMTITCPTCMRSLKVESVHGGLHAPTVTCICGTRINNELGCFFRAA